MKIIRTTILGLAAAIALGASASDKIVVGSVTPEPGSAIRQFNYTDLILSVPSEVASLEVTGDVYYTVRDFGDATAVYPGAELTTTKTRGGDIRIGFSDATAGDLMDAGLWPITAPGEYTITVEAGALKVTGTDGNVYTNDELVYTYELVPNVTYEANPNPANQVPSLQDQIIVTFPEYASSRMTDDYSVSLKMNGAECAVGTSSALENNLVVALDDVYSIPGSYTLTIARGSLLLSGSEVRPDQVNPEITITYDVVGISTPRVISVSPAEGVIDQLGSVIVLYNMPGSPNSECTENLKVLRDGETILEYGATSGMIQGPIDREDPNQLTFLFTKVQSGIYRQGGEYTVIIPEGFIKFSGRFGELYSERLEVNYTIPRKLQFNIDPMPGTYKELSQFTLTFPEAVSITENELEINDEGSGIIQIYYIEGENITPEVRIDGNEILFSFDKVTAPGHYALELPRGAFSITTSDGETLENQYMAFDYYISLFPVPVADPEPGEVVELGQITFTLEDGYTYGMWFPSSTGGLHRVTEAGEVAEKIGYYERIPDENGSFPSVNGSTEVTLYPHENYNLEPGRYALKFSRSSFSVAAPAGSDLQGGFLNFDAYYYYTIIPDPLFVTTPEYPDDTEFENSLESFRFTFENTDEAVVTEDVVPTVKTSDGEVLDNLVAVATGIEDGKAVAYVSLTPALDKDGVYIITLPAGLMLLGPDGKESPEYTFRYCVGAGEAEVTEVGAESGEVDVYGIDGRVIARGLNESAVGSLPAGLYIVNGRKLIVR